MVLEDGSIDMESPDSYISSPDVNHKRSSGDGKEKPTSIRFLVSNGAAGSVIGKGGSTITEFQSQSGARIQLSRNQEYFPGTTDRIIMVSGCVNEILMAIELILGKLQSEMHAEAGEEIESMTKVRLVVPNSACGGIIGKGGSTIKSFIEDSQAGIKISPLDQNYGVSDRVVTVTGSFEEQLRALLLIINKLIEDPNYVNYASQPLSYTGNMNGNYGVPMGYAIPSVAPVAYNMVNYGSGNGSSGKMYNNKGLVAPVIALRPSNNGMPDAQTSPAKPVVLGIADDHIGVLLGRGGRNISEIMQASGAKVKISDRGDFITGTSNRKVTIMGSLEAIHAAQVLINQRLSTLTEQQ